MNIRDTLLTSSVRVKSPVSSTSSSTIVCSGFPGISRTSGSIGGSSSLRLRGWTYILNSVKHTGFESTTNEKKKKKKKGKAKQHCTVRHNRNECPIESSYWRTCSICSLNCASVFYMNWEDLRGSWGHILYMDEGME